jgi:hypothetical protein
VCELHLRLVDKETNLLRILTLRTGIKRNLNRLCRKWLDLTTDLFEGKRRYIVATNPPLNLLLGGIGEPYFLKLTQTLFGLDDDPLKINFLGLDHELIEYALAAGRLLQLLHILTVARNIQRQDETINEDVLGHKAQVEFGFALGGEF